MVIKERWENHERKNVKNNHSIFIVLICRHYNRGLLSYKYILKMFNEDVNYYEKKIQKEFKELLN